MGDLNALERQFQERLDAAAARRRAYQEGVDAMDDKAVASWVDAKLLGFTDAYLRVQVSEQYQQTNMVVDPVCGMRINRADAEAAAEYEGRRYYFCVEQCRQKFLSDPDRYATRRNR